MNIGYRNRIDWDRIRFSILSTVFFAVLCAVIVTINTFPEAGSTEPLIQMALGRSLLFATFGAASATIISYPILYWIYGDRPMFHKHPMRNTYSLLMWVCTGFGFGVLFAILMGAYFFPVLYSLLKFIDGYMSMNDLVWGYLEVLMRMWSIIGPEFGIRFLQMSMIGGLIFGIGTWLLGRLCTSKEDKTRKYFSLFYTAILIGVLLVIVLLVPTVELSRIG